MLLPSFFPIKPTLGQVCVKEESGFPVWLKFIPSISFRTDNEPFKVAMERFTKKIVNMMNAEELFESHGGSNYSCSDFVAEMLVGLGTSVPWIMCKQDDAPDLIEGEFPWHLVSVAFFLILLKLPGPYYPYWGRIFIPHFVNGGLLRTLWSAIMWYKMPHVATETTLPQTSTPDHQSRCKLCQSCSLWRRITTPPLVKRKRFRLGLEAMPPPPDFKELTEAVRQLTSAFNTVEEHTRKIKLADFGISARITPGQRLSSKTDGERESPKLKKVKRGFFGGNNNELMKALDVLVETTEDEESEQGSGNDTFSESAAGLQINLLSFISLQVVIDHW
ncbi:hypothetical protein IFM89_035961 [Coptis chinensis]|uniref:beta-galactosidase n=1 Tax=Coptis chinensis TaxID=261450 RepID=A0A835H300_9MAGN|nr:hypothetical protein IFM89_035961 [Coptis chinensis]